MRILILAGCSLLAAAVEARETTLVDTPRAPRSAGRRPALIPEPAEVVWGRGRLPLRDCRWIAVPDSALIPLALRLQEHCATQGHRPVVGVGRTGEGPGIRIQVGAAEAGHLAGEAYRLRIDETGALLESGDVQGLHNAMATLLQLFGEGAAAPHAEVRDRPAFGWRGFMIDVGRNYMSPAGLHRIIDVMADYKLNVFHFHPTEDIAWRIAVRGHPELTDPSTMLRWPGRHYTSEQVRELMAHCRRRGIRFVLEIDMPGHSAAFRRATGHDMQSDTGMAILKEVMSELLDTYDTEFIHIGADEVRIVNPRFVPEMTRFIRARGRTVLAWEPGGEYDSLTIRHLWRETPGRNSIDFRGPFLDSRHLYLNHHDPLESVVTVFHRQFCGRPRADASALGALLCLWNDRAVAKEADLLRHNPVFPAMLAFAERSWKGGGRPGWIANVPDDDSLGFEEFENRLLRHRERYFQGLPFPYVRQQATEWRLYGPFGRVADSLAPALDVTRPPDRRGMRPFRTVRGGTVVLRHWWAPLVEGAVARPEEHTTVYAYTKFWSDSAGTGRFWVGFNDFSRSYRTDPPPAGRWDAKGSEAWLNGSPVAPPQWARGGGKGHPDVPLVDEGYAYRPPARLPVRQGWNHVWLRLPARSFRVADGNNPEKWMFTFVPVD